MNPHTTRTLLLGATSLLAASLLGLAIVTPRATAYSDLPPSGRTGAPGQGTCASCHGTLNDGLGGVLTIGNVPAAYVPGQTYTLSVSLSRSGKSRWGFELTSLRDSDNAYSGTLQVTSNLTGFQTQAGKSYVSHTTLGGADGTFAGTSNGPVMWSFDWTAPAAGTGTVTFYAVGVAANGDNNDGSSDPVYTTNVSSAEQATTAISTTTWGWIKDHYR